MVNKICGIPKPKWIAGLIDPYAQKYKCSGHWEGEGNIFWRVGVAIHTSLSDYHWRVVSRDALLWEDIFQPFGISKIQQVLQYQAFIMVHTNNAQTSVLMDLKLISTILHTSLYFPLLPLLHVNRPNLHVYMYQESCLPWYYIAMQSLQGEYSTSECTKFQRTHKCVIEIESNIFRKSRLCNLWQKMHT